MQRQAADGHRHRDDAARLLILDVIVVPRMLAVGGGAFAIAAAILHVEDRSAGFDDGDIEAGAQLGQLLRQHRRGDAAADDADVAFVSGHDFNPVNSSTLARQTTKGTKVNTHRI